MYHKVAPAGPTQYWVSLQAFGRQMEAAAATREVVRLADYDPSNPRHCVITFDDAYVNVLEHAAPILAGLGLAFEVFVNGGLLGQDNRFDQPAEPSARICTEPQLAGLVAAGARLQWHTATHVDLASAGLAQTAEELRVPARLRADYPPPHFQWFSYPYGHVSPASLTLSRVAFEGAVAVQNGADVRDRHLLPRVDMRSEMELAALPWTPAGNRPRVPDAATAHDALMQLISRDGKRRRPGVLGRLMRR